VLSDSDGELLVYHYYDNAGTPRLGMNHIAYDEAGWPFVY
jgi:arabinan endo-1,5-alpha-L-arabinosidase